MEQLVWAKNVDAIEETDNCYLGEMNANKEWNDPEKALRLFIHTNAYENILKPQSVLLLGRTGTGKSAMLNCIKKKVENGGVKGYQYVVLLQFSKILSSIVGFDAINASDKTFEDLKDTLEMIINIFAMSEIATKCKNTKEIKTFLNKCGFTSNKKIWDKIQTAFQVGSNLPDKIGTICNVASSLCLILETLFDKDADYEAAKNELTLLTNNANMLVLIDTMEKYDIRDMRLVVLVQALISTSFRFYENNVSEHIYVKLSLHSEIHTHVVDFLPAQQQGNAVLLQWKYRDLQCFLAARFYRWASSSNANTEYEFLNQFAEDDFRTSNKLAGENAAKLLGQIFPEKCKTSSGFEFDTIAYCIRHTLKKPRELLVLFNRFVDRIVESGNPKFFFDQPDEISNIIHSTEARLLRDALSMYQRSYPHIEKAFRTVISKQCSIISGSSLINAAKEAAAETLTYSSSYDYGDILRLLFETGIVGRMNSESELPISILAAPREKPVTLVSTLFEYQIKGSIHVDRKDEYIIHPMCYEHFGCCYYCDRFVYPETIGDDSDAVYAVLKSITK